ncbi:hypothetical protein RCL1_004670 [Eukaryota sp. TZLM3-RCL]
MMIELMFSSPKARIILVGDNNQLSTVADSDKMQFFGKSILDWMLKTKVGRLHHQLTRCYRLPPLQCLFTSKNFYNSTLKSFWNYNMEKYVWWKSIRTSSVELIEFEEDTEVKSSSGSMYNKREIFKVFEVLNDIVEHAATPCPQQFTIIILCAYNAQRDILLEQIPNKELESNFEKINVKIIITTIDSFQGSEGDVVFILTTRSNENIGFLSKRERINVALSRNRLSNIVFGNNVKSFMLKPQKKKKAHVFSFWKEFVEFVDFINSNSKEEEKFTRDCEAKLLHDKAVTTDVRIQAEVAELLSVDHEIQEEEEIELPVIEQPLKKIPVIEQPLKKIPVIEQPLKKIPVIEQPLKKFLL